MYYRRVIFSEIASILCLSGVVPVGGLLLLGMECQRCWWEGATLSSVALAAVVPAGTVLSPRSAP